VEIYGAKINLRGARALLGALDVQGRNSYYPN